MTPEQIQPALQRALGIDIDRLASAAGSREHNLREEWTATVNKVSEFATKYVNASDRSTQSNPTQRAAKG